MNQLTKAEEQIMQELWKLEKATIRQILAELPAPKPAYNTVSTIVRILEKKEIVSHEGTGKTFTYFPLLRKEDYKKASLKQLISGYFEGSFANMASFFTKEEDLTKEEINELKAILNQKLQ
ncbi:MAG: BlaI family penicillinase repressor [Marivirga sp.]|jgi:BlaI family penicillinase repressor